MTSCFDGKDVVWKQCLLVAVCYQGVCLLVAVCYQGVIGLSSERWKFVVIGTTVSADSLSLSEVV